MTQATFERMHGWLSVQIRMGRRFGWIHPKGLHLGGDPSKPCGLLAFKSDLAPGEKIGLSGYEIDVLSGANDQSEGNPTAIGLQLVGLWTRQNLRAWARQRRVAVRCS